MYKARAVTQVITMIAVFLCWLFFADAQSTCKEKPTEEKNTEESEHKSEDKKTSASKQDSGQETTTEKSQKDSKEGREIDLFIGGDDNLQSFSFMIKLPFDEKPFKFERFEGSFSGKTFMTFKKPVLPEGTPLWAGLWKENSDMETASRSYALRVEGSPLVENILLRHLGGYIEFESDYSVDIDPNLHFTVYTQSPPFTVFGVLAEAAVGGWGEFRRLGKATR